jgi:hypothetical protein
MTPECCPCGHPMTWYELAAVGSVFALPVLAFLVREIWIGRRSPRAKATGK